MMQSNKDEGGMLRDTSVIGRRCRPMLNDRPVHPSRLIVVCSLTLRQIASPCALTHKIAGACTKGREERGHRNGAEAGERGETEMGDGRRDVVGSDAKSALPTRFHARLIKISAIWSLAWPLPIPAGHLLTAAVHRTSGQSPLRKGLARMRNSQKPLA